MMMTMAMISPGGQNSLQISSPEEEQRVAAAPRCRSEKELLFWSFLAEGINRAKVGHQGVWDPPKGPYGTARGAPPGRLGAPGCPVALLWPARTFRNAE